MALIICVLMILVGIFLMIKAALYANHGNADEFLVCAILGFFALLFGWTLLLPVIFF